MSTARTKAFRSGNSIAVRLPKEVAFEDGTELVVERSGDIVTIYPAPAGSLSELVERLNRLPQPSSIDVRDADQIPEPKGL
jgi:antitoxin VapB